MTKRVLVVDSYDSFIYNIVQLLEESGLCCCDVVKVDRVDLSRLGDYWGVVLSPGPGVPVVGDHLYSLLERCSKSHRVLGVCLGHQAIACFFGVELEQLDIPLHGHSSTLRGMDLQDMVVGSLDGAIVGRYHSWVVSPKSLASCDELIASSYDEQGNVMSLYHRELPIFGVQFHPESIISQCGREVIGNWLSL